MTSLLSDVLIIGSGISGIRSALDLAEQGFQVTLIDEADAMGGILTRLDYQFPSDGCGMCRLLPMVNRDQSSQFCLRRGLFHDRITLMLSTTLETLDGEPGHYTAGLRQETSWIDADRCMGCGLCTKACPVTIPDLFNLGLTLTKAVHLPVPHSRPNIYTIDKDSCSRCGLCVEACPTGAIMIPEDPKKGFSILVVDDELIVRDSLKEWLEFEGFSVDMAASGQEALSRLGDKKYDMMFLDIKMPVMDGTEVLIHAKEHWPDLTVVMMTAYATVETAVETMKTGAMEYVMKPFDPERVVGLAESCFIAGLEPDSHVVMLETSAVVLSCGTDFHDPSKSVNTYGYGTNPDVITGLEFERIVSRTGTGDGSIRRPSDGKEPKRIAWIQCIGSREASESSSFCSSICCMMALKEAVLAKKRSNGRIDTVIYFIDMRCYEKNFEAYRKNAESQYGVILKRARPHSVRPDRETGDLDLFIADETGQRTEERFDLIVLSTGQRPGKNSAGLSELTSLPLNRFGFIAREPVAGFPTGGVFAGGSFTGLKSIGESVMDASSAALLASRLIKRSENPSPVIPEIKNENDKDMLRDVSLEAPSIDVILFGCPENQDEVLAERIQKVLERYPDIHGFQSLTGLYTPLGSDTLHKHLGASTANRYLLITCLPHLFRKNLKKLADSARLDPGYLDIMALPQDEDFPFESTLSAAIAGLRHATALTRPVDTVSKTVLVVGAGIAGMTASLCIADRGLPVALVEKNAAAGGNLLWIQSTFDDIPMPSFRDRTIQDVREHPLISFYTETVIQECLGEAGRFTTVLKSLDNEVHVIEHGGVIIATGGSEAETLQYGHGTHPDILTNRELETAMTEPDWQPPSGTIVMIQCVGSRDDTRRYCSRVCCSTSLRHALVLKEQFPEENIIVLYRDMMSYGFSEALFKQAREKGILFVRYTNKRPPEVSFDSGDIHVLVHDGISGKDLDIETGLLVLATGSVPQAGKDLLDVFGIEADATGFIKEADSKWRPVDTTRQGIFACGMALGPRNIDESIVSARAAAMSAITLLSSGRFTGSNVSSDVRHSLCSLCLRCIEACPFDARTVDVDRARIHVNAALCQGCGACASACANSAAYVTGFDDRQMIAVIDAVL